MWRERVGRYIDLKQFVTHVALETFLSENDGVLGFAGMANFYLYRGLGTDQHRLIVWDKDHTFTAIDSSILLRADENILFSRALAFDDLRALYLDVLERCARSAVEDNWLEGEIGRASALIDTAAHDDVWKPYANDVYDAAVEFLKRFARQRPAFVLQQVARERQSTRDHATTLAPVGCCSWRAPRRAAGASRPPRRCPASVGGGAMRCWSARATSRCAARREPRPRPGCWMDCLGSSLPRVTTRTRRARRTTIATATSPRGDGTRRARVRRRETTNTRPLGASPYFNYFGANAGPSGLGYYSYRLGDWQIYSLNSNIPMDANSPQVQWLRGELAANPSDLRACVLASSALQLGTAWRQRRSRPLWRALYESDVDVVISGHDHFYERFAPQDPDGRPDPVRGIREFIVGTGRSGAQLARVGAPQ